MPSSYRYMLATAALLMLGAAPPQPLATQHDDGCARIDPPEYYRIDLVPTKRLQAARHASGFADVSFAPSPFGIAVTPEGHYVYDLTISVDNLPPARNDNYVAWISTPDLDQILRLGTLDPQATISGQVQWNKYLVIITLEPTTNTAGAIWEGPVVLRGMSRSGKMHTMAGHGPFQREPCASFGYF